MKSEWQKQLSEAITSPEELLEILELDNSHLTAAKQAAKLFNLKVPRNFVTRMQKNNINDPLLLQVLPIEAELKETSGYEEDPLQEKNANPIPGLLHKYHNRVLITLVGNCAINCRFCFRRYFPYEENNPGTQGWEKIFNYLRNNKAINEVILSGGDPLVANDSLLKSFTDTLNSITHIKRLRIHTRLPIVLPDRITDELIAWLTQLKQKPVIVIHCNHPNEIDSSVREKIKKLRDAKILVLNQSVLLKGVNDCADTLIALSETLFSLDVQPYYLHMLDKVRSTAHFDIDIATAKQLHQKMQQQLPGYLVPKLVTEQPGELSKTWI